MNKSTQFALIALLTGTAVLQAANLGSNGAAEPKAIKPDEYIRVEKGKQPDAFLRLANSPEIQTISAATAGSCGYVIVYSPTCGASRAAAEQWTRTAKVENTDHVVPDGWKAVWISAEDSAASFGAVPDKLPAAQAFRGGDGRIEQALGMAVYPVFMILDRDGRVVSSGVGATLYEPAQFNPDCTIAPPAPGSTSQPAVGTSTVKT